MIRRLNSSDVLPGTIMITSSNGNIFRVIGHLCGEFTGHRWIPPHKGQWHGALMFSLICAWMNGWVNTLGADDLRRQHAHYDVTVMCCVVRSRKFTILLNCIIACWTYAVLYDLVNRLISTVMVFNWMLLKVYMYWCVLWKPNAIHSPSKLLLPRHMCLEWQNAMRVANLYYHGVWLRILVH